MKKLVRVTAEVELCVATLNPFTFICAGQTKQAIRQHTQTAVVKYLVLDKRPVTVAYTVLSYLSCFIHFLYRNYKNRQERRETEKLQTFETLGEFLGKFECFFT